MPAELPVACTLDTTELPERLTQIRALCEAALVSAESNAARAVLRFAAEAGIRERVEGIAAAESRCCAFLSMSVRDEPGTVVLTIDAPEGAELVLAELVDSFGGRPPVAR